MPFDATLIGEEIDSGFDPSLVGEPINSGDETVSDPELADIAAGKGGVPAGVAPKSLPVLPPITSPVDRMLAEKTAQTTLPGGVLEKEKSDLDALRSNLKSKEDVDAFNARVDTYNRRSDELAALNFQPSLVPIPPAVPPVQPPSAAAGFGPAELLGPTQIPPEFAPEVGALMEKPLLDVGKAIGLDAQTIADAREVMAHTTPQDFIASWVSPEAKIRLDNKLAEIQSRQPTFGEKVLAGGQSAIAEGLNFFTSPLGIATLGLGSLPGAAQRTAATLFAAQMAKDLPEQFAELVAAKNSGDPERIAHALTAVGLNAAFIREGYKGTFRPEAPLQRATTKGTEDASQVQKAAEVYGDVQSQPQEGAGQVPVKEGGAGVRPQAERGVSPTEKVLTKEDLDERAAIDAGEPSPHEDAVRQLGEKRGENIQLLDKLPSGENFPEGIIAQPGPNGETLINRAELDQWLKGRRPEEAAPLLESLLEEEKIHKSVTDEVADAYWKDLTGVEQAINKRRYGGKAEGRPDFTDTQFGHEAIRFRMQQLQKMTPREILEAKGKERITVQTITALESVIRKLRETMGTKASVRQRALLAELEGKLRVARQVAPAQEEEAARADEPFAFRKEEDQTPEKAMAALNEHLTKGGVGFSTEDALNLGDSFKTPEEIASLKDWVDKTRNDLRAKAAALPKTMESMDQKIKLLSLSGKLSEVIEGAEKPKDKPRVQEHFAKQTAERLGLEFDPGGSMGGLDKSEWFKAQMPERQAEIRAATEESGWHFMPPKGAPNAGLSFYTRKGASPAEIKAAWKKKQAEEPAPAAFRKPENKEMQAALQDLQPELIAAFKKFSKGQELTKQESDLMDLFARENPALHEKLMRPAGMALLASEAPPLPVSAMGRLRGRVKRATDEGILGEQEPPGAFRKKPKPEERGQEMMALPSGATPEERISAEQAGAIIPPPITAERLAGVVKEHVSGNAPSFAAFAEDVNKQFGDVQPGQLNEAWQDAVWNRLNNASAEDLRNLRSSLGLKREIEASALTEPITEEQKEVVRKAEAEAGGREKIVRDAEKLQRQADDAEDMVKAKVSQRDRADSAMDKLALDAEIDSAESWAKTLRKDADELLARARETKAESLPAAAPKGEREPYRPGEMRRENAIARIAEKMIGKVASGKANWKRRTVTPDEIGWWRVREGKKTVIEPAFREIAENELKGPLGKVLTSGAAMSRKGKNPPPMSVTKRVTAFLDRLNRKVELLGTHADSAGNVFVVDPKKVQGRYTQQATMLPRFMAEKVGGQPRYLPLYSILLDEPVQWFRQTFKNVNDFMERFGDAAEEAAASQRPGEAPPEDLGDYRAGRTLKQPEFADRPAFRSGRSLTDAEAGSILDTIMDEVGGRIESIQDMDDAMTGLKDRAFRGKLSPRDKQTIVALEKAVAEYERRNPDTKGTNEAVEKTLEKLYENASNAENREAFVQTSMGDFSRRSEEGVQAGQPQRGAEVPRPTGQELTMLNRRPPTAVAGQQAPPGPGPAAELGGSKEPAAFRKDIKIKSLATLEESKQLLVSAIRRRRLRGEIPTILDGVENNGNNFARKDGDAVRVQARIAPPAKATRAQRKAAMEESNLRDASAQFIVSAKNDPANLEIDLANAKRGLRNAIDYERNNPGFIQKRYARAWQESAKQVIKEILYARNNWAPAQAGEDPVNIRKFRPMRQLARELRNRFDDTYELDLKFNPNLKYFGGYVPGRYETPIWYDSAITFGHKWVLGLERGKPKTFRNRAEAIAEGYISRVRRSSDLLEHRSRQSQRQAARSIFIEQLKDRMDPVTGDPIVRDPVYPVDANGKRGAPRAPNADYKLLYTGSDLYAVHKQFVKLVEIVTGQGRISANPVGRAALNYTGFVKHAWQLIFDTFHPGRLGEYGAVLNMGFEGKRQFPFVKVETRPGYSRGVTALDYHFKDLDMAVRKKMISPEDAAWAQKEINVNLPGTDLATGRQRTMKVTQYELANELARKGLNVGRIQDALYKHLVDGIAGIGEMNRWTFDRLTRGLMTESGVNEFVRLNKAFPELSYQDVMKKVIRDTNVYYGSLGRQGIFVDPTWREASQLLFLAPQWVEGLVQKELRFGARLATAPVNVVANIFRTDANKRIPMGTIGRGMARGLVGWLALTQVINLISRGKPTWQNDEPDHKWDAWIPDWLGHSGGYWVSPMSVFAEITHDLVRYAETKKTWYEALETIGENKLSIVGKAILALVTRLNPKKEVITTTGGVLSNAAREMLPAPLGAAAPISLAQGVRALAHAVAPEKVAPNNPGAVQRQLMASVGVKTQPEPSAQSTIFRLAQQYADKHNWQKRGFITVATDEESYGKLRHALDIGDAGEAKKQLADLRKFKRDDAIYKAMQGYLKKGFTGSTAPHENQFKNSLTPQQAMLYQQAKEDRKRDFEAFKSLWADRP